jgi:hypothetical protein
MIFPPQHLVITGRVWLRSRLRLWMGWGLRLHGSIVTTEKEVPMKVTWRVINKFKQRLQHAEIPDEEIRACGDAATAYEFIEEMIESEFKDNVYWNFHDNKLLIEDIDKVFNDE